MAKPASSGACPLLLALDRGTFSVREWDWFAELGEQSRLRGMAREACPFPLSSPAYRAWLVGYDAIPPS